MICSEIQEIEEIWKYDSNEDTKQYQYFLKNLLNNYDISKTYDVILDTRGGVSEFLFYSIEKTRFWENRVVQILFVLLALYFAIKLIVSFKR